MEKYQYKELVLPEALEKPDTVARPEVIHASTESDTRNKRISRRNRVLLTGEIRFNESFASIKCIIRNISDSGALLKITDTNAIPGNFTLEVPMQGFGVKCQIVDQSGLQIRVKFTSEKHQLQAKKVQYIDATSSKSDGRSAHHEEVAFSADHSRTQHTPHATRNLISQFRQRNLEPE